MTINAAWHKQNPMPKNPTLDERLDWHRLHAEHCACRRMPENLARLLAMRAKVKPLRGSRAKARARRPKP